MSAPLSGRALKIATAAVFEPLLTPSRYKAVHGGRGSGKSHFFAEHVIEESLYHRGLRTVCIREVQKSLKESSKRLIEDKLIKYEIRASDGFKVFNDVVETPGGGLITFQGMQDHTAESIKSLEGYNRAWVEEAQTLSARSLALLRPTIRADDSELWFSWNPTRKSDAVDQMFRSGSMPTGSAVVRSNYSDNPWFPAVIETERQDCIRNHPEQYRHIWEGDYATVLAGAYYAQAIALAMSEGRVSRVTFDPLMEIRTFWDIGVKDATAIWVAQFVGREIRVLDYYEAQGQPLATHLNWLREKGYGKSLVVLPHDGSNTNAITATTFQSHIEAAGFRTQVVSNQGRGAALKRVEASRRLFPSIWFNQVTTQAGIDALGWYHEKRDPTRNVGLGPDHDWSSHGADAFGLMCVAYEEPRIAKAVERRVNLGEQGSWMS